MHWIDRWFTGFWYQIIFNSMLSDLIWVAWCHHHLWIPSLEFYCCCKTISLLGILLWESCAADSGKGIERNKEEMVVLVWGIGDPNKLTTTEHIQYKLDNQTQRLEYGLVSVGKPTTEQNACSNQVRTQDWPDLGLAWLGPKTSNQTDH